MLALAVGPSATGARSPAASARARTASAPTMAATTTAHSSAASARSSTSTRTSRTGASLSRLASPRLASPPLSLSLTPRCLSSQRRQGSQVQLRQRRRELLVGPVLAQQVRRRLFAADERPPLVGDDDVREDLLRQRLCASLSPSSSLTLSRADGRAPRQAYDSTTKACRNVQTDPSNCGALGRVCPAQNGVAKCWAGQCSLDCASDSVLVQGVCQKADLLNDATNWCVPPLTAPLAASTPTPPSPRSGKVGLVCPTTYANGGKGTCRNGVCSAICDSLFDFDVLFGFCRDVSQDKNNWYVLVELTISLCVAVRKMLTLLPLPPSPAAVGAARRATFPARLRRPARAVSATLRSARAGTRSRTGVARPPTRPRTVRRPSRPSQTASSSSDAQLTRISLLTAANCGRVGNACQFSPSGATGVCKNSQCVTTGCPSGYSLASGASSRPSLPHSLGMDVFADSRSRRLAGVCVKQNPSAHARLAKKDKLEQPKKLCPASNEQACPILGSSCVISRFSSRSRCSAVVLRCSN